MSRNRNWNKAKCRYIDYIGLLVNYLGIKLAKNLGKVK
jgi:hypothetical protein